MSALNTGDFVALVEVLRTYTRRLVLRAPHLVGVFVLVFGYLNYDFCI